MRARRAIGRQRDGAEQLGELAGRAAAQQIHLEETLLRVHVAERPGQIAPVRACSVTVPSASRSTVTGADSAAP